MKTTEKLSVTVPVDMAGDLRAAVESGEFASTGAALLDAVRVWRRQRSEDADRLASIRARIRRSLDDPRPNLTPAQVDAHLDAAFVRAQAEEERRRAHAPDTG